MKHYLGLYVEANGIFYARYQDRERDPGGRERARSTGMRTREGAEAVVLAWQQYEDGDSTAGDLLRPVFESYLQWGETQWAAPTKRCYYHLVERLLKDFAGHRTLGSITPQVMVRWLDRVREEGRGPHSVRNQLRFLRTFFRWAIQRGHCNTDPTHGLRAKVPPPRPRPELSPENLSRILRWVHEDTIEYPPGRWLYYFVGVAAHSGFRYTTIEKLEWQHCVKMDTDRPRWSIPPELWKGGKAYEMPMSLEARDYLVEWGTYYARNLSRYTAASKIGVPKPIAPADNVFPDLDYDQTNSGLKRACRALDLPLIGAHDLRRYYQTVLRGRGVDPSVYAKIMGHHDPATSLRHYAVPQWSELEEAIQNS